MASDLIGKIDQAVASMRSGSDHDALRALLELATEPPTAVLESLLETLGASGPRSGAAGATSASRLPDPGMIDQVFELVGDMNARGLMDLGGGTYDGMVALLVATVAALGEGSGDKRTGAPS